MRNVCEVYGFAHTDEAAIVNRSISGMKFFSFHHFQ